MEPGLKHLHYRVPPFNLPNLRGSPMKSLIALTAIAVFTVAAAVIGKPSAFATDKAIAAAKSKPVMVAEQRLPFDRARSQN